VRRDLYLAGLGSYLPQASATEGNRVVRVARDGETGPVMAAQAGRLAVQRSGLSYDEFGLVLHAGIGYQGRDFWPAASFVQNETVGRGSLALELRGDRNGALAALDLAACYLTAGGTAASAALVTAGDAFRPPYVDRWAFDDHMVPADGAAAAILSTRHGFARVRSIVSAGDPALEAPERGSGPWNTGPAGSVSPAARRSAFARQDEFAWEGMRNRIAKMSDLVVQQALDEAGCELTAVRFFVSSSAAGFPSYEFCRLGIAAVGAASELVALTQLVDRRRVRPGDLLVVAGCGAGAIWTVAVVEFLEAPQW
jgi:3-oxoacyl-[acyl-carrier-protein] synthase III